MNINLTLFVQALSFALFIWITIRFVWPEIIKIIEQRQTQIADGLAAAERGSRSLEEAKVRVGEIVEGARSQARQIIDQANARATSIIEDARSAAKQEHDRILASAEVQKDQLIVRARDELRGQVAGIVVAGAEKILEREIDPGVHRELLSRLAAQL